MGQGKKNQHFNPISLIHDQFGKGLTTGLLCIPEIVSNTVASCDL